MKNNNINHNQGQKEAYEYRNFPVLVNAVKLEVEKVSAKVKSKKRNSERKYIIKDKFGYYFL